MPKSCPQQANVSETVWWVRGGSCCDTRPIAGGRLTMEICVERRKARPQRKGFSCNDTCRSEDLRLQAVAALSNFGKAATEEIEELQDYVNNFALIPTLHSLLKPRALFCMMSTRDGRKAQARAYTRFSIAASCTSMAEAAESSP